MTAPSKVLAGFAALVLLAGCTKSEQQAETTQPAASQQNQPSSASTTPPPSQPYQQGQPTQAYRQPTGSRPSAPPSGSRHMVSVPAGTVLTLALDSTLNSKTAVAGDSFTATVVDPILVQDREVITAGSKIEGKITEAVAAKRGAGNAKLALSFDTLRLESGYQTSIVGSFQEVTESKKKRNAAIIGGSAAGGALLGRILGKDTKGAVVGAIVGGGIGTAVVMGKEGEQAKLPADTPFEIRLEEAVQLPHEPSKS